MQKEVQQPWKWHSSLRKDREAENTASEKEWEQQTAEKCLLQEEKKVEKYYPHNLFMFIKAAVSVAFCSS